MIPSFFPSDKGEYAPVHTNEGGNEGERMLESGGRCVCQAKGIPATEAERIDTQSSLTFQPKHSIRYPIIMCLASGWIFVISSIVFLVLLSMTAVENKKEIGAHILRLMEYAEMIPSSGGAGGEAAAVAEPVTTP